MAGYIGKSQGVTQVDGYTRNEADAEYVNDPNAALNISSSASANSATLDASGNLLVGKTAVGSDDGVQLRPSAASKITQDSQYALILDRHTSDGGILEFRKDETTVGSIGTSGSALTVNNGNTGLKFVDTLDAVYSCNGSGATTTDTVNLGVAGSRFKDLFLSGGVYLGGTGSANYLDDYEASSFVPNFTNMTLGNGTVSGQYVKVGDVVYVEINVVLGSTTSISGSVNIVNLPFVSGSTAYTQLQVALLNSGSYWGAGIFRITPSSTAGSLAAITGAATSAITNVTATTPFTWAANDQFNISGSYRVA